MRSHDPAVGVPAVRTTTKAVGCATLWRRPTCPSPQNARCNRIAGKLPYRALREQRACLCEPPNRPQRMIRPNPGLKVYIAEQSAVRSSAPRTLHPSTSLHGEIEIQSQPRREPLLQLPARCSRRNLLPGAQIKPVGAPTKEISSRGFPTRPNKGPTCRSHHGLGDALREVKRRYRQAASGADLRQ